MSFGGLTALQFWLGLGALGAVLAALQILRVRQREIPVVTTLFWRQAIEETRARVFRHRFRHVGTWMFLLLICGLLWLAMARPRFEGGRPERTVCLLDGSADMARGQRFADAVSRLEADVAGLPADTTEVIYVGGEARTLLAPGEDRLLLAHRLRGVVPQAAAARLGAVIDGLLRAREGALRIRVYGDGALPGGASLPEGVHLARVDTGTPVRGDNASIAVLGVAEASSGASDAVDVLVAVHTLRSEATGRPAAGGVRIALDDQPLTIAPQGESLATDHPRWRYRDVPARGQRLTVALQEGEGADALALDDSAEIVLPNRPVLRVFVDAALRSLLAPVLAADSGLRLVASAQEEADVAIVGGATDPQAGRPTLWFDAGEALSAAVYIEGPAASADLLLTASTEQLALAQIDGAALAQTTGRTIAVDAALGDERRVRVWRSLLRPELGFVASRAFPLFVAGALRWLGGQTELISYVAAGQALPARAHPGGYTDPAGRYLQPLGAAFTPPVAGSYQERDGRVALVASLLAGRVSRPADDVMEEGAAPTTPFPLVTLLILLAFALLWVEWTLFRTGRIP